MSTIINLKEIKAIVKTIDVIAAMKEGFIQYSNGNTVVPPVGELIFDNPPGDVHIKYGYIKDDHFYVIKIASGFYENPKMGIPSGQGLMLLFDQKTGQPVAVLLDEGHLTDIRTAAAGALAVKYFAPKELKAIGIIGTGMQANLQLLYLQEHNPCSTVWLWGRNKAHALKLKAGLGNDFDVTIASTCTEVAQNANVIITTTPSEVPLLKAGDIMAGTLIVAVGSDTRDKQELDSEILQNADLVIADSLPQSTSRGEIYQAIKAGSIAREEVVELGTAIQDPNLQRVDDEQIIVVDLTGVAVQDIMIASAVYMQFSKMNR
ncbi:MAG: ornithine cyclodeaminase family protein [Saprospiraceae bacterium]|nr:ornithine cyclodeaminase family protein [Saprospiraceae bacterium]